MNRGLILCYVLGCREVASLCTHHKVFGLIASCGSHNPDRHGYGLPEPLRASARPSQDDAQGGSKVRSKHPVPVIPGGAHSL